MSPEAQDYLTKAHEDLADDRKIQSIGLGKVAARGAYYAAFHAAEALLIEWTGKAAKTHSGVRAALAQVLKQRSGSERGLLTFLAQAYKYKELGDYAVGRTASVTDAEAAALIEGAADFIARIAALLAAATNGR